ncbi:MAG: hypothetical protein ACI9FO_001370 [Methylophagaceae bacterium]|jgi:hypothetical protein
MTCSCAVHFNNSAVKLNKVMPIDLDNTPWINLDPEHTTTKDLIKTCAKHATCFNPTIEVDTTLQVFSL